MTKFLDGPAAGVTLSLRRAPVMLRVVVQAQPFRGKEPAWDALDQLDDEPKPHETIHVYQIVGRPTFMHIRMSGKGGKRGSGYYAMAEYRFLPDQPGDQHTRSNEAWAAWCDANKERLLASGGAA